MHHGQRRPVAARGRRRVSGPCVCVVDHLCNIVRRSPPSGAIDCNDAWDMIGPNLLALTRTMPRCHAAPRSLAHCHTRTPAHACRSPWLRVARAFWLFVAMHWLFEAVPILDHLSSQLHRTGCLVSSASTVPCEESVCLTVAACPVCLLQLLHVPSDTS